METATECKADPAQKNPEEFSKREIEFTENLQVAYEKILTHITNQSQRTSKEKDNLKLDSTLEKALFKYVHDYMKRRLCFYVKGIKAVKLENEYFNINKTYYKENEENYYDGIGVISYKKYHQNVLTIIEERNVIRELHVVYSMLRGSSMVMIEGGCRQENKVDPDVFTATAEHIIYNQTMTFAHKYLNGKIKLDNNKPCKKECACECGSDA